MTDLRCKRTEMLGSYITRCQPRNDPPGMADDTREFALAMLWRLTVLVSLMVVVALCVWPWVKDWPL